MQLSKNFTLAEMLKSDTASRLKYDEQFDPPGSVIDNLKLLCENILQPLRDKLTLPIVINSGYRCLRLNQAVGGQVTSQHMKGQAVDIHAIGISNKELAKKIQELDLPYDQLLLEFGTKEEPAWIHVSYTKKPRKQVLTIGV